MPESGGISSIIVDLGIGMEMSDELHAPAVLPPGKEPPVPIGWEAGWTSEPVWTL
jgi:hypothetical protein